MSQSIPALSYYNKQNINFNEYNPKQTDYEIRRYPENQRSNPRGRRNSRPNVGCFNSQTYTRHYDNSSSSSYYGKQRDVIGRRNFHHSDHQNYGMGLEGFNHHHHRPRTWTNQQNILKPPEDVVEKREECASKLAKLFPTKKIVKKTKRDNEDLFTSNEDESTKKAKTDDGDETVSASDLTRALVTHVTTATPVQDFDALLRGEAPNFNLICNQMGDVILQLADNLGGNAASNEAMISRILDCLVAFRRESCIIDPSSYNKFLPRIKDLVSARSFQHLWDRIKEGTLGLVTSEESLKSSVTAEAATTFLELEAESQQPGAELKQEEEDFEDLLDDL